MENKELTPEQIARSSLLSYIGLHYPKYQAEPMHKLIATALENVEAGRIKRLLIFAPPQHGKPVYEEEQVLMGDGTYKKLKDIKVGDYVITHKKRPRKVLQIFKQGKLPTVQLNTRSDRNPCAAKDHPFLTIQGWVEAGKLKINDSLALVRQEDILKTSKFEPYYPSDTIISIEDTGMRKCRCLMVEDDHTFTIQNIVVHNSMLASEFFPAWAIGRNPDWKIIAATFNQTRANEVGTVVRDQLRGSIHKSVFPECTISPDTQSSQHVATTTRGHYYSIGLSGTGTGRGADLFLVDDPFKGREDSESKLARKKVNEDFYAAVAYSRLRPGGRIIIINTRWHREDLSGYVLENFPFEDWKIIDLKAIAEEEDILGRKRGDALCPNMYPLKELEKMKRVQGTYNWESLYQQRPIPREGGMIKYEWIEDNWYDKLPEEKDIIKTVISWDTAYRKDELNDPTAASVWKITKNGYYLVYVFNKQLAFHKIIDKIKELHLEYKPAAHLIEGRASGQPIIDELKRLTTIPVIEVSTNNLDKEVRLSSISGLFESGKVHFPEKAPWLIEAKDQLCLLPSYKYDDIADSIVHFLRWSNRTRYARKPKNKLYWK